MGEKTGSWREGGRGRKEGKKKEVSFTFFWFVEGEGEEGSKTGRACLPDAIGARDEERTVLNMAEEKDGGKEGEGRLSLEEKAGLGRRSSISKKRSLRRCRVRSSSFPFGIQTRERECP